MNRYYFTVSGMGIEKGIICFTCVHTFIKNLGENKHVKGLNYSSVEKHFVMDTDYDDVASASAAVLKSLDFASNQLNKDFLLTEINKSV